ncbi:hypothetical protein Syun_018755 [Stephania yunnanensis]|uniref:Uncharacterized protein n=1 Tax=Stephania yunnanensis TaxID=152371 RepID=A0AAP0ISU4_9MAGN
MSAAADRRRVRVGETLREPAGEPEKQYSSRTSLPKTPLTNRFLTDSLNCRLHPLLTSNHKKSRRR